MHRRNRLRRIKEKEIVIIQGQIFVKQQVPEKSTGYACGYLLQFSGTLLRIYKYIKLLYQSQRILVKSDNQRYNKSHQNKKCA
jgi:hypothetical protein